VSYNIRNLEVPSDGVNQQEYFVNGVRVPDVRSAGVTAEEVSITRTTPRRTEPTSWNDTSTVRARAQEQATSRDDPSTLAPGAQEQATTRAEGVRGQESGRSSRSWSCFGCEKDQSSDSVDEAPVRVLPASAPGDRVIHQNITIGRDRIELRQWGNR